MQDTGAGRQRPSKWRKNNNARDKSATRCVPVESIGRRVRKMCAAFRNSCGKSSIFCGYPSKETTGYLKTRSQCIHFMSPLCKPYHMASTFLPPPLQLLCSTSRFYSLSGLGLCLTRSIVWQLVFYWRDIWHIFPVFQRTEIGYVRH
jgi:hypothetical protein